MRWNTTWSVKFDRMVNLPNILTFSRIVSPSFSKLAINSSTGVLSFTPDNDDVGSYFIRIIVTDGFLIDFEDISLQVINFNFPPSFF